jgi:hypothetical protein
MALQGVEVFLLIFFGIIGIAVFEAWPKFCKGIAGFCPVFVGLLRGGSHCGRCIGVAASCTAVNAAIAATVAVFVPAAGLVAGARARGKALLAAAPRDSLLAAALAAAPPPPPLDNINIPFLPPMVAAPGGAPHYRWFVSTRVCIPWWTEARAIDCKNACENSVDRVSRPCGYDTGTGMHKCTYPSSRRLGVFLALPAILVYMFMLQSGAQLGLGVLIGLCLVSCALTVPFGVVSFFGGVRYFRGHLYTTAPRRTWAAGHLAGAILVDGLMGAVVLPLSFLLALALAAVVDSLARAAIITLPDGGIPRVPLVKGSAARMLDLIAQGPRSTRPRRDSPLALVSRWLAAEDAVLAAVVAAQDAQVAAAAAAVAAAAAADAADRADPPLYGPDEEMDRPTMAPEALLSALRQRQLARAGMSGGAAAAAAGVGMGPTTPSIVVVGELDPGSPSPDPTFTSASSSVVVVVSNPLPAAFQPGVGPSAPPPPTGSQRWGRCPVCADAVLTPQAAVRLCSMGHTLCLRCATRTLRMSIEEAHLASAGADGCLACLLKGTPSALPVDEQPEELGGAGAGWAASSSPEGCLLLPNVADAVHSRGLAALDASALALESGQPAAVADGAALGLTRDGEDRPLSSAEAARFADVVTLWTLCARDKKSKDDETAAAAMAAADSAGAGAGAVSPSAWLLSPAALSHLLSVPSSFLPPPFTQDGTVHVAGDTIFSCPHPGCGHLVAAHSASSRPLPVTTPPSIAYTQEHAAARCTRCTRLVCRLCTAPWSAAHEGRTCDSLRLVRQASAARLELFTAQGATFKTCPGCGEGITHYRGHGCHHITHGGGCGTHFCAVCNAVLPPGGPHGCPLGCPLWCDREGACGCADCPDCKSGAPCGECDGCRSGSSANRCQPGKPCDICHREKVCQTCALPVETPEDKAARAGREAAAHAALLARRTAPGGPGAGTATAAMNGGGAGAGAAAVPPAPPRPVVRPEDIWQIAPDNGKLCCGVINALPPNVADFTGECRVGEF